MSSFLKCLSTVTLSVLFSLTRWHCGEQMTQTDSSIKSSMIIPIMLHTINCDHNDAIWIKTAKCEWRSSLWFSDFYSWWQPQSTCSCMDVVRTPTNFIKSGLIRLEFGAAGHLAGHLNFSIVKLSLIRS